MLILLSPAKSLDYDSALPPSAPQHMSAPAFEADSQPLINILREKSAADLSALMDISSNLAELNVSRFRLWAEGKRGHANARHALFAFNGDVYEGLDAKTLSAQDVQHAQNHLRILSGLYGLLRPQDALQPYRLEMGTRLPNPRGKDLYAYWRKSVTQALNETLAGQAGPAWILNLASQEYAKAVDAKALAGPMVSPQFLDGKAGKFKVVSFYAKRARGLMARFALQRRVEHPNDILGFDAEGYSFSEEHSLPLQPAFVREA